MQRGRQTCVGEVFCVGRRISTGKGWARSRKTYVGKVRRNGIETGVGEVCYRGTLIVFEGSWYIDRKIGVGE